MPSTPRRSFLRTLPLLTLAGGAGCMGETGDDSTDDRSPGEQPPLTSVGPDDLPARGHGDPVTVERTVSDQPGYADDMEYFPGNETVRVVEASDGTGPITFGTLSVSQWASRTATAPARDRALAATRERLGLDRATLSVTTSRVPDSYDGDRTLGVFLSSGDQEYATLLPAPSKTAPTPDRPADSTPAVPLTRLVETAPRTVEVTISIEETSVTEPVPVFATA